jgi:hypothetical protein
VTDTNYHIELTPNQMFTGGAVTFDIQIIDYYGDEVPEKEGSDWDCPALEATITDQAQLRLRQTELIEPSQWLQIVGQMMTAIEQARDFAGTDWALEQVNAGPPPEFKGFMTVGMRTGTTQKSDDLPEEGEAKALRIDYRIERDGVEVQTGMVDWQNGLYVWDSTVPFEFWELPLIATVIDNICQKCKELMVDHRCWE